MPALGLAIAPDEESLRLRFEIFARLEQLSDERGGFLTLKELTGFELNGIRRPLAVF
jgi:hypothetical protein